MIEYSLIIPHHNSPDLLQRCLDSVPIRSDLEIIIVDDNSSSTIVDFEKFPGLEQKNVKCIFDKSGKGAGHARNIGLSKAVGRWLVFADADDYYTCDFNIILDKYKGDKTTDMVFLNYRKIDENGVESIMPISRYINNYKEHRLASEKVLRYRAWSPWSRMVKRQIQLDNNILFEELPFSNDMMFVLQATLHSKNIKTEEIPVYYYYCPQKGSQTSYKFYSSQNIALRFEAQLKLRNFYKQVGYKYISPLWREERILKSKCPSDLKARYKYHSFYNIIDTWYYILAKIVRII